MRKHKLAVCCLSFSLLGLALGARPNFQSPKLRSLRVLFVDKNNHSVDDIQEQDLEVLENGVRQQITLKKDSLPVRYALVIDTSGSLRSQFPNVLGSARAILTSNSENDETAVVRFVDTSNIQVIRSFTSEKALLFSAVDALKIERGQTAVVDAIYASVEFVRQRALRDTTQQRNNALVIITDGENRNSRHQPEELAKFIQSQNIRIFCFGLVSELDSDAGLIRKSPLQKAQKLLVDLAANTGGRTFFVKSERHFREAISEIVHDLHNDYLLTYSSTADKSNPTIKIKVTNSADNKKREAIFSPGVTP